MGLSSLVLCLAAATVSAADGVFPLAAELARSPEEVELASNWKFRSGDDPAWAAPRLDDSDWEPLDHPSLRTSAIPSQGWDGKGWFRLRLATTPEMAGKPFALYMWQAGASEIYLDGALVRKYGVVGTADTPEREYNPQASHVTLVFTEAPEHVLAVRYSCKAAPRIARGLNLLPAISRTGLGFNARIAPIAPDAPPAGRAIAFGAAIHFGIASFVFGMAAVHFVLYFAFGRRTDHLFYAVFVSVFAFVVALSFLQSYAHVGASGAVFFGIFIPMIFFVSGAAYIAFLNTALKPTVPASVLAFVSVPVVFSIAMAIVPEITMICLVVLLIALVWMYAQMGVLVWRAARNEKRSWRLLAWSVIGWVAFQVLVVVGPGGWLPSPVMGGLLLLFLAMIVLLPSIYLIQKIGVRHASVEGRLKELRTLYENQSSTTLARERRDPSQD